VAEERSAVFAGAESIVTEANASVRRDCMFGFVALEAPGGGVWCRAERRGGVAAA
jgi:hypothetical protein